MRIVKFALFATLVAVMGWMWGLREDVVSAYTEDPEPIDLRFDGLSLTVDRVEIDRSPFIRTRAPRTRQPAPALAIDPTPAPIDPAGIVPGRSDVTGTVTGIVDGVVGPVEGAIVLIERHSSGGVGSQELVTGPDGTWSLDSVSGGRYRVRTFVPGQSTSGPSIVFFLESAAVQVIDLSVTGATPGHRFELFGPEQLTLGADETIAVTVSTESIDGRGVRVLNPVATTVNLTTTDGMTIRSLSAAPTDAGGAARYLIRCDALGARSVTVATDGGTTVLALPLCLEPVPEPAPDTSQPNEPTDESTP